jgi:diacylglycerol kinase (ATP)
MAEIHQALVIYNPASGTSGDLHRRLSAIVRRLDDSYVVTVRATTPSITAEELLAPDPRKIELVIVCGGDGTIGVVLGAVAETNCKAKVGIVPFGTGNLLAHHLGICPRNQRDIVNAALDTILDGQVIPMNLGRMNEHWFTIDAGTGPISNALTVPRQKHKKFWHLFVYAWPLLKSITRGPRLFKISVDGEEPLLVPACGVFVTTIGEMGIGNEYDYSQLNSGTLDLIVMNPKSFSDYLNTTWRFAAWNIFNRKLGEAPPYSIRKVRSVDIDVVAAPHLKSPVHKWASQIKNFLRWKADFDPAVTDHTVAMVDGDRCGSTPMHIEIVPNAVQLIVPCTKFTQPTNDKKTLQNVVDHAA